MIENLKTITIIHPFDPTGSRVGGIGTHVKGFIKYAPDYWNIEHIGIRSFPNDLISINNAPDGWISLKMGSKEYKFLSLLTLEDENKKTAIPLSLRFTLKLRKSRIDWSSRTLVFHRIEPVVIFRNKPMKKCLFVHNDIRKQMCKTSEVFWKNFPSIYFMFEKKVLPSVDYIYTVSNNTLEFYKERYHFLENKISFLPTWVDPEIFSVSQKPKDIIRKELLADHNIPTKSTWIIFVGRLQEQKAPLRLLDSFSEYLKFDSTANLLIIGEGNLKQQMLRKIDELTIGASVHFLGWKEQMELAKYYQAADVLLLTSNFEGMPMCCLEALGCGLPVVSTDVGETRLMVKDGFSGEIVSDGSISSIAQAIRRVVENSHIFSAANCLASVKEYTPPKVLATAYDRIEKLSYKNFH